MLTIGEAARLLGTTTRALRFYHSRGLVPEPARDALGHRRYDVATLHSLKRLLTLRELGLPLSRCADLLRTDHTDLEEELLQWEQEIVRRQEELEQQRLLVVQLREDHTRTPFGDEESWSRWEKTLTDRGVPSELLSQERTAARLLSLIGEEDPARSFLPDGPARKDAADVMSRFAKLSPSDENTPKIERLIEDLVAFVGPFVSTMANTEPSGPTDKLASELLSSFPPPQRRVMREVMLRIAERLPPP